MAIRTEERISERMLSHQLGVIGGGESCVEGGRPRVEERIIDSVLERFFFLEGFCNTYPKLKGEVDAAGFSEFLLEDIVSLRSHLCDMGEDKLKLMVDLIWARSTIRLVSELRLF